VNLTYSPALVTKGRLQPRRLLRLLEHMPIPLPGMRFTKASRGGCNPVTGRDKPRILSVAAGVESGRAYTLSGRHLVMSDLKRLAIQQIGHNLHTLHVTDH
jgi:hypothetical protein